MPGRKKNELVQPVDYNEARDELILKMTTLHISRIEEMPRIELYLDQLLSIISTELAPFYDSDEKIVTGSMVNNYVKQRVIPAPARRRYTHRHVASLIIVCSLKRVLSIAQVSQLIALCEENGFELTHMYDTLVYAFEQDIAVRFANVKAKGPIVAEMHDSPIRSLVNQDGRSIDAWLATLLESTVSLLANKVYVEKLLALDELRERQQPQED